MGPMKCVTIAALFIGFDIVGATVQDHRQPCPPLFFGQNCSECRLKAIGICDFEKNVSYLHIDYQLFFNKKGEQLLGSNIFENAHQNDTERFSRYQQLPASVSELNDFMCNNITREGEFCGKCKPGHAPSPYTYYGVPCTKCHPSSPGWLYYILLELSFPTVMFFVFLVLRIRITSNYMVAFALYCQIIAYLFNTPFFYYLLTEYSRPLTHTVLTFYGIWNMDFFRLIVPKFCVSRKLGTVEVVALGYISAFYPLLLTIAAYVITKLHHSGCKLIVAIWRPLHRHSVTFRRYLRIDASLVDVFATFLLFSYSKILFVSLEMILPLKFYTISHFSNNTSHPIYPHHYHRVTYKSVDPQVDYSNVFHLPFLLLAFGIVFVFCTIPPLLLCLYPSHCMRKVFGKCRFTSSEDFVKLIGAFQDGYKNGTNGTRDYRPVSSLYATHRVSLFFFFLFLKSHDFITVEPFLWQAVMYILTFAFYAYARPYKSTFNNNIELLLLLLLIVQSILNFQLYTVGCEVERFKDCSRELHILIIIQFCVLCIPQGALVIYLLWLLLKKASLRLERHKRARLYLINTTLCNYSSLSLNK